MPTIVKLLLTLGLGYAGGDGGTAPQSAIVTVGTPVHQKQN